MQNNRVLISVYTYADKCTVLLRVTFLLIVKAVNKHNKCLEIMSMENLAPPDIGFYPPIRLEDIQIDLRMNIGKVISPHQKNSLNNGHLTPVM